MCSYEARQYPSCTSTHTQSWGHYYSTLLLQPVTSVLFPHQQILQIDPALLNQAVYKQRNHVAL